MLYLSKTNYTEQSIQRKQRFDNEQERKLAFYHHFCLSLQFQTHNIYFFPPKDSLSAVFKIFPLHIPHKKMQKKAHTRRRYKVLSARSHKSCLKEGSLFTFFFFFTPRQHQMVKQTSLTDIPSHPHYPVTLRSRFCLEIPL